jgi:hypothetical protein
LGFRTNIASIWTLLFYPVLLTLILFLGPIVQCLSLFDWKYLECHVRYMRSTWTTNEQLIVLRNYIIAPLSEGRFER